MSLRFLVRGTTAAACAALLTAAGLAPAQAAAPGQPLASSSFGQLSFSPFGPGTPLSPATPSDQDIAEAKKSESATAAAAAKIDELLASDNARLDSAMLTSMGANDAYTNALSILNERRDDAETAAAKAKEAGKLYSHAKTSLGQLAGSLYKTGGLDPTVQQFLSDSSADDTLYQATALMALTATRSQTFESAAATASTASALQAQAVEAQKAADAAANAAVDSLGTAQAAADAQAAAVKESTAQRKVLLDQLATLHNTTAALEGARVDAVAAKAREEALKQQIDSSTDTPAPAERPAVPAQKPTPGAPNPPVVSPKPPVQTPKPPVQSPQPKPPVESPKPKPPVETPKPKPPVETPKPPVVTPPTGSYTQVMVNYAMSKIGGPYEWGGTGPVSFDCSGLVLKAFAAAGISVPRQGTDQFWAAPQRVPLSQMQYGDLLVFNDNGAGQFSHIAIYIGNNQVVQALQPGQPIQVTPLSWMSGMRLYPFAARY